MRLFDYGVLGMTRPEKGSFYGLPWSISLAGAGHVGGPTVSQACATGLRAMLAATQEVDARLAQCALAIACDRTSNCPHLSYPNPDAAGGTGEAEDWMMQNMACDPMGGHSMTQTARESRRQVSRPHGRATWTRARREERYRGALAEDCAFQRRCHGAAICRSRHALQEERR